MPHQPPPTSRRYGAVFAVVLGALLFATVGCSSDQGEGPGEARVSGAPPTSEPIFARRLGDPVDDRVNPTAPATVPAPATPKTPILHVLGSIASATDPSPDWQARVPVAIDDVATIATLACDPTVDGCSPAILTSWAIGAVDLVNVATEEVANSSGDLAASIAEIRSAGIEVIGYGSDQNTAISGVTVQRDGVTISLHAISLNADPSLAASETQPGIVGPDAFDDLLEAVASRREAGDAVVVFVDLGANDDRAPSLAQIAQVQRLVDLQIDAIVGTGSDFLQRFDRVADSSVAYSLGHAMTETVEPLRTDSAVLRLEFATPGRACLLPSTASASGLSLDDSSVLKCGE